MKTNLNDNLAYIAARKLVERLQKELIRLDNEIAAHDASAIEAKEFSGNPILRIGLAVLDGQPSNLPQKRMELCTAREAISAAIVPAIVEIEKIKKQASMEYFKSQSLAVLEAMDALVASLNGVVNTGAAFEAIRHKAESLGYDSDSSGLPISVDKSYTELANSFLPELRKDADRLRDSLDKSLDNSTLRIRVLLDTPWLKGGQCGSIPTRVAREMIRSNQAEEVAPNAPSLNSFKAPGHRAEVIWC